MKKLHEAAKLLFELGLWIPDEMELDAGLYDRFRELLVDADNVDEGPEFSVAMFETDHGNICVKFKNSIMDRCVKEESAEEDTKEKK